ncbi:hypothetical protein [Celeribacter sp. PS-C1]|uniref:hypothetical protein n=1 Tax=Celeribacter sp. PS-C1 TaxID=2820813 RepID=UPI001CA4F0AA|nr:hypothetical protein [Celeribacter sp. PS-C1]MBW6416384.1 hypothetical protein [Celeribacter sp. PS-C1]
MAASEGLEGQISDTGFWATYINQVTGQKRTAKPVFIRKHSLDLKLIPVVENQYHIENAY